MTEQTSVEPKKKMGGLEKVFLNFSSVGKMTFEEFLLGEDINKVPVVTLNKKIWQLIKEKNLRVKAA